MSFSNVQDVRRVAKKARTLAYGGGLGGESQSLAYFLLLEDVANGVLQAEVPSYAAFADVWDAYCKEKLKDEDGNLKPYGKSVARTIFIGKPKLGSKWLKGHTTFPLHNVSCHVCLFLVTVVRRDRDGSNPYSNLDLKTIHEYFKTKIVMKDLLKFQTEQPEPAEEQPDYRPLSPVVDVESSEEESSSEEDEVVEPAPPVVESVASTSFTCDGKRKRGKNRKAISVPFEPKVLETAKLDVPQPKDEGFIKTFVPGEMEW